MKFHLSSAAAVAVLFSVFPDTAVSATSLREGAITSDAADADDGNGSRRSHYNFLRDGKLPILTRENSQVLEDLQVVNVTVTGTIVKREFSVFAPANEGDAKLPLVIVYHGVEANSETMRQITQFDREAKDRGWLAVYPQGLALDLVSTWNGAGCCTRYQDDIAFSKVMIDHMVQHFNADEDKVFVTGVSNGGFMVYRLLSEMGNRENGKPWIAAAGVHSGLLGAWNADFSSYSISKDTPLVHFHGRADYVVPIKGKPQGERAVLHLATVPPVTNAEWKSIYASIDDVANAMCGSTVITHTSNPTESTTCYELCQGKVEYCLIDNLGHHWSGCSNSTLNGNKNFMYDPDHATNVDATKYFADFFSKHT